MKPIEPDTHITAPPSCARESPSRKKDVSFQLPPNSSTTEPAQQALSDCETDRNTPSQLVSLGAIETTGTDSHGQVRLKESVLSSILDQEGDLESSLLPTVLRILGRLQDEFNLKHRFHLFVESVEKVPDEAAGSGSSTMCPIFTRVAFSPTLFASDQAQKTRLAYVCQKITEFSFGKMPHSSSPALPALTHRSIAETGGTSRQRLSFPSVTVSEQQGIDTNIAHAAWPLRVYENLIFPSWCPCQTKEYTTPPQASEERLFISKSVLERFIELEDFQIMWIYQELFKFLYRHGRKKKISGMARTLTYSQFTPPWIRRQIAIQPENPDDINGDGVAEVVTLKKIAITHLRNERNTQGYRRVRFLLTAFFCHEPETLKPLIQHLFRTVPSIRAVTKRKVSKKRNHPNEHSQPQGNAQSNKRLESESEQARLTSSTNRQDGSSSTTANGRRSQRPQSSTETHEIQQNPHPPNAVLSQITADIRTNVRTPLHSNVRAPSQSTTNAISANNEASNPTPTRSLGLIANVSSSQENKTTQLLKRKSVFDGTPSNSTRIQENMQPGPYPSNQISREETGAFAHIAETTREQQENAENQSTPPEKHLLQPGLSPTLQEEEERIIEQLKDLGEDKEDLTDPRNGVVKCGSLARCVYILNHFMQSEKEVDGNCKRCNYKMHKRCVALHNVCDKCVKHTVFKSIYDADI